MKKINKKFLIVPFFTLSLLLGGCSLFPQTKSNYNFVTVKTGDINQQVNVTGQVKPAQSVDLAFQTGGKVKSINVEVGQTVISGQTLISLEAGDIYAAYQQAQSAVDAQQAKLNEMKKGARPEDLQLSQTQLTSAQNSLENAKIKAQADLKNVYDSALNTAQKSVTVAKNSMLTLTDIQSNHFLTAMPDRNINDISDKKSYALVSLLGADYDSGKWTAVMINPLAGGAYGQVYAAANNPTSEKIDQAVNQTINALQKVKISLDSIPVTSDLTATEKSSLSLEKTNIANELIGLSAKQESIRVQSATNNSLIAAAQAAVDNAQSALVLKQAGVSTEQIQAQEAVLRSAQASVAGISASLNKMVIKAPIDGVVTRQDAKQGEIVAPSLPIISLSSKTKYQIEVNIAEADIAKVKVGDKAKVTLDAYGGGQEFDATIVSIDPAETIINGLSVYKSKLQFNNDDDRIKSGLTANIKIGTENKTGVLIIPTQTVLTKGLEKIVMIDSGNGVLQEKKIETGLTSSDGQTEIISGLKDGDKVVDFGNPIIK